VIVTGVGQSVATPVRQPGGSRPHSPGGHSETLYPSCQPQPESPAAARGSAGSAGPRRTSSHPPPSSRSAVSTTATPQRLPSQATTTNQRGPSDVGAFAAAEHDLDEGWWPNAAHAATQPSCEVRMLPDERNAHPFILGWNEGDQGMLPRNPGTFVSRPVQRTAIGTLS